VLRHWEAVGFDGAPQVLGVDERGREILTYLSGETIGDRHPWPAWAHSEAALTQVGAWARRLHDATMTFVPPEGVTWFVAQTWRTGLVVGHHDAAPYNAVWRDGRLVGFVDWDTAGPSSREVDLAFVALSWVPLLARRVAEGRGFTAFDDRSRRLHCCWSLRLRRRPVGLRECRCREGAVNAAAIHRLAAGGDPMYVALLPVAADLEQAAREVEALPVSFWLHPAGH
jgi:hypothetical protein